MPFGFRKSVSLGGGMRMTFSPSGVSTSVGGKGYRVTTGPKGTYVTIGAKGVYYRQKIGGRIDTSSPAPRVVTPVSPQPAAGYSVGTPIVTADAGQLVELSSAATLEQLNTASQQPVYAWMFAVGDIIAGLLLTQIHVILFVLVAALSLYVASIANGFDKDRRNFCLNFDMDRDAEQRWNLLNQAVTTLSRSHKVWRVNTHDYTYDQKRNAGASALLTRALVAIGQQTPLTVTSNVTPYRLDVGTQTLFFFPDRIYVLQDKVYGAVEYSSLNLDLGQTQFVEEQGVPSDSEVVGQTWRFVNKNGGPDRRFNNNYQIPIARYAEVGFKSSTGMNLLLQVSSVAMAQQFCELFRSYQNYGRPQQKTYERPSPKPQQDTSQQQSSSGTRQRRRTTTPPAQPSSPDCYTVLGLSANCTKEEATAKYRQMVKDYHPDRVSHMAPEFREFATRKLQEINNAADELKRLRGW